MQRPLDRELVRRPGVFARLGGIVLGLLLGAVALASETAAGFEPDRWLQGAEGLPGNE